MRTVYGDVEADAVGSALHIAYLGIVIAVGEEVERVELLLCTVVRGIGGTYPVDERTVSCITGTLAVLLALFGTEVGVTVLVPLGIGGILHHRFVATAVY